MNRNIFYKEMAAIFSICREKTYQNNQLLEGLESRSSHTLFIQSQNVQLLMFL